MSKITKYLRRGLIINDLMGADLNGGDSPEAILELQGQGQNCISIQIRTIQGVAAPDHVGVVKWDRSNRNNGGWDNVGSQAISSGSEAAYFSDNILTAARYMRIWYDYGSGGDDDTLEVVVNQCV